MHALFDDEVQSFASAGRLLSAASSRADQPTEASREKARRGITDDRVHKQQQSASTPQRIDQEMLLVPEGMNGTRVSKA